MTTRLDTLLRRLEGEVLVWGPQAPQHPAAPAYPVASLWPRLL